MEISPTADPPVCKITDYGKYLYQGLVRASVIAASGVLFGWFAYWRKSVRPGMVAHTLQDAVAPLLLRAMRR